MSWGAVIAVGGSLLGGALGSSGAKRAAREQARATQAAVDEERRQFDLTRNDLAPYREIGRQALGTLGGIYGYGVPGGQMLPPQLPQGTDPRSGFRIGPGGSIERGFIAPNVPTPSTTGGMPTGGAPDYTNFFASPDYQFRRGEGTRGIERSFAARGLGRSGNALAALDDYNSELASGEFGNFFNRQAALAGVGQSATAQGAQLGAQTAGNIGNALVAGGDARASGIAGQYNAWGNALGDVAGYAYDRWGRPKKGP